MDPCKNVIKAAIFNYSAKFYPSIQATAKAYNILKLMLRSRINSLLSSLNSFVSPLAAFSLFSSVALYLGLSAVLVGLILHLAEQVQPVHSSRSLNALSLFNFSAAFPPDWLFSIFSLAILWLPAFLPSSTF